MVHLLTRISIQIVCQRSVKRSSLMRGREGGWWRGLALFGGGYLVASHCPVGSELATTRLLRYAISQSSLQPVVTARVPAGNFRTSSGRLDEVAMHLYARNMGSGTPLYD